MLALLQLLVHTGTLRLFVDRTYDFTNEMTILCLFYCKYAQMDILFCQILCNRLTLCELRGIFQWTHLLEFFSHTHPMSG